MKGIGTKRKCRRFLALLLAVMLALPALPVLADGDADEGKTYDVMKLKRGDILQPGDKLEIYDESVDGSVIYMDADDEFYLYSLSLSQLPINTFVKSREIATYESFHSSHRDLCLDPEDFDGWKVEDIDWYEVGSLSDYCFVLKAVSKTKESASVKTRVLAEDTNGDPMDTLPNGAGVELWRIDLKTGEPFSDKGEGTLSVRPGEVVYVCTKPVSGYYSKISIWDKDGGNEIEYPYEHYCGDYHGIREIAEWNTDSDFPYWSDAEHYEFLPKDLDAVTAFPVPYEDVTVEVTYCKSNMVYEIEYSDPDDDNVDTNSFTDEVPINAEYTIKSKINNKNATLWRGWRDYHQSGDKIRARYDDYLEARFESNATIPITGDALMKAYYSGWGDLYSVDPVQASSVSMGDGILIQADTDQISNDNTLEGYRFVMKEEGGESETRDFDFNPGLNLDIPYGGDISIHGPVTITPILSTEKPEDLLVDLSKTEQIAWKQEKEELRNVVVWNSFVYRNKAYGRSDAMESCDFANWRYNYPADTLNNPQLGRLRLLDLNSDGIYDVSLRLQINQYSVNNTTHEALTWTLLGGAEKCPKDSYDIKLSRHGYGILTIKLREPKEDPKEDPDPKPQPDPNSGKKEVPDANQNPSDSLKALEEKITSTKNEKDIEGALFHLLQVKAVPKSDKAMKVTWKKVSGATQYIIYGAKCGKKDNFRRITTTTKTSYTRKKLKKGNFYKFIIVAVNGDTPITIGKTVHAVTKGTKLGNNTEIKLSKKKVKLKVGGSKKIKATAMADEGKKVRHHRNLSWESDNEKIATVDSKGKIKAVSPGVCFVYAYAQNGVSSAVKVTVK